MPVSVDLEASNGPVRFRASRLPAGLSLDAVTGVISGRPTRGSDGPMAFTVTASNEVGASNPVEFAYTVTSLDEDVSGVFRGLVERSEELGSNALGGAVSLTVTSTGSFSGRLELGLGSHAFKGQLLALTPGGDASASVVIERPAGALTLDFSLNAETARLTGALSAGLESVPLEGYRKLDSASAFAGLHTAALEISEALAGNMAYPQGNGFASLTVTSGTALVKYAGRLADGTSATLSTAVLVGGACPDA